MTPSWTEHDDVLMQQGFADRQNRSNVEDYNRAAKDWYRNDQLFESLGRPRPAKPAIPLKLVVTLSAEGKPELSSSADPACAEYVEAPSGTGAGAPTPGSIVIEIGAQSTMTPTMFYCGKNDTAPDGFTVRPLGTDGPQLRKRIQTGGAFGVMRWYEVVPG